MSFEFEITMTDDVDFSDEELFERSALWQHTIMGCVMVVEVSWGNMLKCFKARWKNVVTYHC